MKRLFDIKKTFGKIIAAALLFSNIMCFSASAQVIADTQAQQQFYQSQYLSLSNETKDELNDTASLPLCSINGQASSARCLCAKMGGSSGQDLVCEADQVCRKELSGDFKCVSPDEKDISYTKNTMFEDYVKTCEDDDSCLPACKYKPAKTCTLCKLFALVFNTVSRVGSIAINSFSVAVAQIVAVAFGVWLAIQILAFVASVETRDLKDLISAILNQGFIVALVFIILQSGVSGFYTSFINPVYETGQLLAQQMFDDPVYAPNTGAGTSSQEITGNDGSFTIEEGSLPVSMGWSIIKTMTMMENHVLKFKALGSAMMCQSWDEDERTWWILPVFIYLFTGFALWVLSMIIILAVPFLMVDAVFQLGVAMALLPAAIGGFAFRATRKKNKKVWETFLNSMFAFVFISIVVLLVLATLQEAVTDGIEAIEDGSDGVITFDDMFESSSSAAATYFEKILESFSWASPHFLKLGFIFLLAWSVMKMAKEFAGEFASSISSTEIGSSIGTMAASTAKGMAVKAGRPIGRATRRLLWSGAKEVYSGTKRTVGSIKYGIAISRFNQKKTKEENGKKSYTNKKGNKFTFENGVVTKEKGNKITIRSKDITIVRTKQIVNGKEVFTDKVSFNNRSMEKMLKKDGSFDQRQMDKMLQGLSVDQKKTFRDAIDLAIVERRFNISQDMKNTAPAEVVSENSATGERITKTVNAKGEVIFIKVKRLPNGLLETSFTKVSADGKVKELASDGIHNKMTSFRLKDGAKVSALHNLDDVSNHREKDAEGRFKGKVSWGYTEYYVDAINTGVDPHSFEQGMLSEDEAQMNYEFYFSKGNEFQKADMNINFK